MDLDKKPPDQPNNPPPSDDSTVALGIKLDQMIRDQQTSQRNTQIAFIFIALLFVCAGSSSFLEAVSNFFNHLGFNVSPSNLFKNLLTLIISGLTLMFYGLGVTALNASCSYLSLYKFYSKFNELYASASDQKDKVYLAEKLSQYMLATENPYSSAVLVKEGDDAKFNAACLWAIQMIGLSRLYLIDRPSVLAISYILSLGALALLLLWFNLSMATKHSGKFWDAWTSIANNKTYSATICDALFDKTRHDKGISYLNGHTTLMGKLYTYLSLKINPFTAGCVMGLSAVSAVYSLYTILF